MAEFRISSLRYNYVGIWQSGTVYAIDDIVYFEGQAYSCNIPHTATNFNSDLNLIGQIDAVDFYYWDKVVNGTFYKYAWASTQTYNLNNIVSYGGSLWICNTYHVSSSTFATANFTLMIEGAEWANNWSVSTSYGIGDVIRYGGIVYTCNTNHVSASTTALGLENDFSKWTAIYKGIDYKGAWAAATRYKANDLVKLNSNLYICTTYHTSSSTFTASSFTLWLPAQEFKEQWSSSVNYQLNDVVIYGGNVWYSIDNNNLNNSPNSISSYWNVISPSYNIKTTPWSVSGNYRVGDVVLYNGRLYRAVTNSQASNPAVAQPPQSWIATTIVSSGSGFNYVEVDDATDIEIGFALSGPERYDALNLAEYRVIDVIGNVVYFDKSLVTALSDLAFDGDDIEFTGWNYQDWQLLAPSENYRGFWNSNSVNYSPGDLTIYKNNTWRCVVAHDSDEGYPPSHVYANGGKFWTVHLPHAQQNALINQGDMVYNSVTGRDDRTNLEIGTETYQIRSTNNVPVWDRILTSPNVYYVALDGSDDPDFGITWDQPWRTIQYATQNVVTPCTIYIKSGTYEESLPIIVPAFTALVGDELRGVVVRPAIIINTYVYATSASTNILTTYSTEGMEAEMPLQFVFESNNSPVTLDPFETDALTLGTIYYVKQVLSETEFTISETVGGAVYSLDGGAGLIQVVGGDALKNMFLMHDGTGLRNMTLIGLLGTLSEENNFGTRRPTGSSYVSLDPGSGPADTGTWISTRSPYIQNITAFGVGCTALKIDGTLHNGGNKSIVANDFTHIINDGIGVWCTGRGSKTELVSIFSYYGYSGYFAEDGGRIRATNGNSSYGTYGVIAEGFDDTEAPITGIVYNREYYPQPNILTVKSLTSNAQKLSFSNAGKDYYRLVTNMLQYSNDFQTAPWSSDSNVSYSQNTSDPYNKTTLAWALTGTSAVIGSGYVYQTIDITPSGKVYTGVFGANIIGSGNGATFTIAVKPTGYEVTAITGSPFLGGQGYAQFDEILISGSSLGGITGIHDATITVSAIVGNSVSNVTITGTVPEPTIQNYIFSIYVKPSLGNSVVTLAATYSGSTPNEVRLAYDFNTLTVNSTVVTAPAHTPTEYGFQKVDNNWYRIWFRTYDINSLNSLLTFKIYAKKYETGLANSTTYFYGAQIENSPLKTTPGFYLSTKNAMYSAYADFLTSGAGTGLVTIAEELRSNSVYRTRVVDTGLGEQLGGTGYQTASNNAQGGNGVYVVLAGSDIAASSTYLGLRIILTSGTGVGQYGLITNYDPETKYTHVAKESYDPITVLNSTGASNKLNLESTADMNLLYTDMPVTFYPTVYTANVTTASKTTVVITTVVGGQSNTMSTASISQLYDNMPVSFEESGLFGGVITDFTYYVINVTETSFQLSTSIYGTPIFLVSGTGTMIMNIVSNTSYFYADSTANMFPNMTLQFTGSTLGGISAGTVYYVSNVIDSHNFTISSTTTTTDVTAVASGTNYVTIGSTSAMASLFPVVFSGTPIDTIVPGTRYYISKIVDSSTITISSSLYRTITRSTEADSNVITVDSTSGFIIGNPIKFVGISFGGVNTESVYYISRIISSTQIQISSVSNQVNVTITATDGTSNYISGTTTNLTELYPIRFIGSGLSGSGITTGTTYYVSKIVDSGTFTVSSSTISTEITGTTAGNNQVSCTSTNGFVVGNPIIFYGLTTGGLISGTVYYIAQIDNLVTFRISATPGGGTLPLTNTSATTTIIANTTAADLDVSTNSTGTLTALTVDNGVTTTLLDDTGYMLTETTGVDYTFITASGTMSLTTTPSKTTLITSKGSCTALYNSDFISGISAGTTYYLETIDTLNRTVTLVDSLGGTQVDVDTSTYSMQMVAAGWDHFVAGSDIEPLLDTTTQYFIEPRTTYSKPPFNQSVISFPTQTASMTAIGYGDNLFIALTPGLSTLVASRDTVTWNNIDVPITATWSGIAFGNGYWNLVSSGGVGTSTALYTTDPETAWKQSDLPSVASWGSIVYGDGTFVTIDNAASSNKAAYSLDFGATWIAATLPAPSTQWTKLVYGQGKFVAIQTGGTRTAVSYDGITWTEGGSLPSSSTWSSIAYGNGRFIVVSSAATTKSAWSLDGLTWSESVYDVRADHIAYGQGVFVAIRNVNTLAYTTEDGIIWTHRTVTGFNYNGLCFGYTARNTGTITGISINNAGSGYSAPPNLRFVGGNPSVIATASCTISGQGSIATVGITFEGVGYNELPTVIVDDSVNGTTASFIPQITYELDNDSFTGLFVTVGGNSYATSISAGVRARSRVEIISGIITDFKSWEPGSGYTDGFETLSIYDTNATQLAATSLEIGNAVLGHPLIVNPGIGFSITTTDIVVNGDGYAEDYQAEYNLVFDGVTAQPSVGSNLVINGNNEIYKITDVTILDGSIAPNLRLRLGINPPITSILSPVHGTSVIIREKYSQVRLTGHDFLNIGYGDQYLSGYPGLPTDADAFVRPNNQTVEVNYGRVFYTSTDQDGNFKVGNFFGVEQATGIVTLSASQFGLEGLTQLRLGGISVGSQSVVITQVSTDPSMISNSDSIIVTQKAIKTYIANRLSQGGSNVVTSTMNAGTVVLGGQNFISSTVPAGQLNSSVRIADLMVIEGQNAGVDGDMAAWFYYMGQGVWRN